MIRPLAQPAAVPVRSAAARKLRDTLAAVDDIRQMIQTRLRAVLGEADRLRAVLVALDAPDPVRPRSDRSPPREEHARQARRGSVRRAVLDALSGGDAMTAGEIAAGGGLQPTTVSTTLARLVAEGVARKAPRGYELAAPSPSDPPDRVEDPGLQALRAELRAGLRTPTTR